MVERKEIYFVSDVHLGLSSYDPAEREERFVSFLKSIPHDRTKALYLLGDIWDFWYEYRDVVPRIGARVVAEFVFLLDAGVEVWFCPGNHDVWSYSFFEELGLKRMQQPHVFEFAGKVFCVGHGDLLGGAKPGYRLLQSIFKNKFAQTLFGFLHPWIAFRFGLGWSCKNRKSHKEYHFRGEEEPLYKFAVAASEDAHVDYFVFGHYHDKVDLALPTGARLIVLKDWMGGGMPHAFFNGSSFELRF